MYIVSHLIFPVCFTIIWKTHEEKRLNMDVECQNPEWILEKIPLKKSVTFVIVYDVVMAQRLTQRLVRGLWGISEVA